VFRLRRGRKEREVRGNSGVLLSLRFFNAGLEILRRIWIAWK
jgi:hypothetical protein